MDTSTTTLISIEEYLASCYRPDCDFVDGEVRQRNVGEFDHARLQMLLSAELHGLERKHGFWVLPEMRVQVNPRRFRVPDICIARGPAKPPQILVEPPLLCVEILSPSDTIEDIQERVDDYLAMGVPFVWVLSPRTRRGWIHTPDGVKEAKDGILRTAAPDLAIPLASLFHES